MNSLMGGASGGASGGAGGGAGVSSGGSAESSVISKEEEVIVEQDNTSSTSNEVCDESELELGLGLSLCSSNINNINNNNTKNINSRFFTAKNLPTAANHNVSVGTKRAASPTASSQVVGWPPIRSYRMNSMANQAKSVATGENNSEYNDTKRKDVNYGTEEKGNGKSKERAAVKSCLFVKVNMDGVAIGRKVDLNAHSSYESLAQMLEDMFTNRPVEKPSSEELILMPKVALPSKLLDGSSDFVLTYEDKDGDWMLVGDVPWGMFLSYVKRLRIMRTSEANGLAPRSEERNAKQRSRPI